MTIHSAQNPKIQQIRALLNRRKDRNSLNAFVIEGVRLVEECLKAKWLPELVLVSERLSIRGLELVDRLSKAGVSIESVDSALLESLTDAETSQGILALLKKTQIPLPTGWDFLLIADNLRDPGNLGTLLRTAAAAGADGLLLTPGTVDPFSPKVLRAGMGAHFSLPIQIMDWPGIADLCMKREGKAARILVADSSRGDSCWQTDFRSPLALVIGGEAEGVQKKGLSFASGFVHIPMPGKSESLNAAAAAAILLFEVVRQRKT